VRRADLLTRVHWLEASDYQGTRGIVSMDGGSVMIDLCVRVVGRVSPVLVYLDGDRRTRIGRLGVTCHGWLGIKIRRQLVGVVFFK
jgi:hypothetical protein